MTETGDTETLVACTRDTLFSSTRYPTPPYVEASTPPYPTLPHPTPPSPPAPPSPTPEITPDSPEGLEYLCGGQTIVSSDFKNLTTRKWIRHICYQDVRRWEGSEVQTDLWMIRHA